MSTAIIVQARMTSTRLPGKVLKQVLGKSLLEYLVERLRRVSMADAIVIATTVNDADQPIVDLCRHLHVPFTRGSEHDVLARYYEAADLHRVDTVVRITSDCPLIDPMVVDEIIGFYMAYRDQYDYVASGLERTYPLGMDAEVFSFSALAQSHAEAIRPEEREHVTPFIYGRPGRFRLANYRCREGLSHHRWTVDTPEDFALIEKIIMALYPVNPNFGLDDIAELLKIHPEWQAINAHVQQKKLGQ